MIRSFPLPLVFDLVSRPAWQLVPRCPGRTSIQLILYLPNYTILFLIGTVGSTTLTKKRNLTCPILFFTLSDNLSSIPMLFKMFYYRIQKEGKNKFDFFDGQFVHERIFYFYFSTERGRKRGGSGREIRIVRLDLKNFEIKL